MNYKDFYSSTGSRMPMPDMNILYKTAKEINAKNIIEIGCAGGGSSVVLGQVAKENNGHLYCIDPRPESRWQPNIDKSGLNEYITLIKLPSPWINITKIKQPIDYIFIDGNHKTRWVISDYHFFEPFVRIGGRIAFHDIYGSTKAHDAEWVNRAIDIIMEDDSDKMKEIGRTKNKGGVLVLEKTKGGMINPGFGRMVNDRWRGRYFKDNENTI